MVIISTPSASSCSTWARYGSTVDGVRGGCGGGPSRALSSAASGKGCDAFGRQLGVLLDGHARQAEVVRDLALADARSQAMDQFAKVMHV